MLRTFAALVSLGAVVSAAEMFPFTLPWDDASETPNVTLELVRRGYSEEDIAKLWGGNLLRVWREVERVAAESTR